MKRRSISKKILSEAIPQTIVAYKKPLTPALSPQGRGSFYISSPIRGED